MWIDNAVYMAPQAALFTSAQFNERGYTFILVSYNNINIVTRKFKCTMII